MSYVSGFMMGAAIGKSIRQMMTGGNSNSALKYTNTPVRTAMPAKKHMTSPVSVCKTAKPAEFFLVAKQPGRRRYRYTAMNQKLALLLETTLTKLVYIKSVKINSLTGSILIFHDGSEEQLDKLAQFLEKRILKVKSGEAVEEALPREASAGDMTKSVRHSTRTFSDWLKEKTCGWLDISSILSLFFIFRGIRKMFLYNQYPSGPQMLWWAVSLMRGWRTA